jgi:hypothetical protein
MECGLSRAAVYRLVERGQLHPLYRGVFMVGHARIVDHGRLIGALLAAGPTAWLSHRTAAAVYGLRALNVRRIELTVPGTSTRRLPGLELHRATRPPFNGEVRQRNGLRVSSVARMLVELAPREKPTELNRLITVAARKGLLNIEQLAEALRRHRHRPGIAKLRAAAKDYLPRDDRKSELERAFDRELPRHPDIPQPLRNIHIDIWEIDCYWPQERVALELDGRPYHVAVADIEKDRVKDAKLLGMGIAPMRITDRRWEYDRAGAMDDLRALLELRAT